MSLWCGTSSHFVVCIILKDNEWLALWCSAQFGTGVSFVTFLNGRWILKCVVFQTEELLLEAVAASKGPEKPKKIRPKKVKIPPSVRHYAEQHGIDMDEVLDWSVFFFLNTWYLQFTRLARGDTDLIIHFVVANFWTDAQLLAYLYTYFVGIFFANI